MMKYVLLVIFNKIAVRLKRIIKNIISSFIGILTCYYLPMDKEKEFYVLLTRIFHHDAVYIQQTR